MVNFSTIEKKWQSKWKKDKIFEPKLDKKKKKFFFTTPYPYISGSLHIGHGRAVIESDIYCRYKRMKGFNVLFPLAFHITGTPVLGISSAIEQGDEKKIKLYKSYVRNYIKDEKKVNEIVESFKDPWNIVKFFIPKMESEYQLLGLGIDWTRKFTTGDKDYQQLITWQFNKYKDKDYLVKGSYPVLYCPNCKSAVGEDDIQDADTNPVQKQEYTLLKFKLNGYYLIAATLRPETVYGQTNLWVNPEIEYVEVNVSSEIWVMSKECYEKLNYQKKGLEITGDVNGKDLIGRYALAPGVEKEIIILPSTFVAADVGTGIVTSVPSDAPYDYMAIKDLQKNKELCEKYNLDFEKIKQIKVIPIVKTDEYGNEAGVKVSEDLKLKDQNDPKLKEATQLVYKAGFHTGVLLNNCGKYSGMKVIEAKDKVKTDLINGNKADLFYDITREAFCRCGGRVTVSVLEDQWFLDFNAKDWKEKAYKCLKKMEIVPESYRKQFLDTFEWLDKRPAARKRGIGTPLPFNKDWIVESLSDSTIYMAFYTIKNLINKYKVKADQLSLGFFDYVFLGKGIPTKISKETKIKVSALKDIKANFDYWYPNDHRHTFVAHLSNHLSFFIFAHAGIFPERDWPKKITIHGFVVSEGIKMSKSKGNVITLLDIKKDYGADVFRSYMCTATNPDGTFDWKNLESEAIKKNIHNIYANLEEMIKKKKKGKVTSVFSKAFLSKFEECLVKADKYLGEMRLRDYGGVVIYDLMNHLRKLKKKVSEDELRIVYDMVLDKWLKALMPVVPHMCEELWSKTKSKKLISLESWPKFEKKFIDKEAEKVEEVVDIASGDIRNLLKLVKKKANKVYLYVIPKELKVFENSKDYFEKEFGVKFEIFANNDKKKHDPLEKAKKAKLGKPAIYLE